MPDEQIGSTQQSLTRNAPSSDASSGTDNSDLDSSILLALHEAALTSDRDACKSAISAASKQGISNVALADLYIPAVAREMGDMWCQDNLGFAEVTIGVARLQALLRDLGPEWTADMVSEPNAAGVLLITPRNATHTMGAVVLAGQLRRRGFSVRLAFDADRQSLAAMMDRISFDAVFVSASHCDSLDKLRRMIEFVRTLSHTRLPVIIGGSITSTSADVASMTGADAMTSNLDKALDYCGLIQTQQTSAASAKVI